MLAAPVITSVPPAPLPTETSSVLAGIQGARAPEPVRATEFGNRTEDRATDERDETRQQDATEKSGAQPIAVEAPPETAGRNLNLVFEEDTGKTFIEILDPRTGDVVERIPPELLKEREEETAEKDGVLAERGQPDRAQVLDQTV